MGWKRINGREYYYRCERVEGRVTTTYLGAGDLVVQRKKLDLFPQR